MLARDQLDKYTLAKLQGELNHFGISNPPKDREICIAMIMDLFERNKSRPGSKDQQAQEAEGVANSPCSSAGQPLLEVSDTSINQSTPQSLQRPVADNTLSQMCTLLASHIHRQNRQASQQQELLNQLLATLSIGPTAARSQKQDNTHPVAAFQQNHNSSQVSESFSTFSNNASKFLSSQIPQFGRTEEENIEIWIEKVEIVASIHGFPQGVILSAAFSRLTKSARRRFDYSTGSVNSS